MLKIIDLHVEVEGVAILKGFSLEVKKGEIHAIMGPNGAGKSTLAKVIAGHPSYTVTKGEILFEGENVLEMDPEERAWAGLFMSFQYPLEIAGITNFQFLRHAYASHTKSEMTEEDFRSHLLPLLDQMRMKEAVLERDLNDGFSGGEKKRSEILQMLLFAPKCAILDETDSGLDIDALKVVAEGVNSFMNEERSLILITHYQRLLDYIKPNFVHVMQEGRIVRSGGPELALELEAKGYVIC